MQLSVAYVTMCVRCLFRGAEFRPDYRSVASLRSIFSSAACVCLSGTVTKTVLDDVLHILQLRRQDVHVSALLPDRPNIYIDVRHAVTYTMDQLAWLADELENRAGLSEDSRLCQQYQHCFGDLQLVEIPPQKQSICHKHCHK